MIILSFHLIFFYLLPCINIVVIGIVFPSQQEAAYANHRAWQGFGFGVAALYSSRFESHIEQLHRKLWFLLALLLFAMVLFALLECRIRRADIERKLDSPSDIDLHTHLSDTDDDSCLDA